MSEKQYFTLQQVSESIRKTIAQRYAATYWVKAEMYKLNMTRKGHCYPELVQKENEAIIAEMRGTIWKMNFDRINARFVSVVNEPLKDGLELLFEVKIVYHPIFGIGLDIIDIDPIFTLGAMQRERQETLDRLTREGIFNANQQLKFPLLPKRLAIISQANSKGYSDFVLLLNGHPKRYRFSTFLFEAILQGDSAVQSITAQLNRIERIKEHFDAVLIIRGGGGEVGMHCYNNYELARAIATFPLPVLTGVGHSTNMTVCEMIAYNNGITPSDLAYWFRQIMESLDEPLDYFSQYIPQLSTDLLQKKQDQLSTVAKNIRTETVNRLLAEGMRHERIQTILAKFATAFCEREKAGVANEVYRLKKTVSENQRNYWHTLGTITRELQFSSQRHATSNQYKLESVADRLHRSAIALFPQERQKIVQRENQVEMLDPANVLKRGYSIVRNASGVISRSNQPKNGDKLTITTVGIVVSAETEKTEEI